MPADRSRGHASGQANRGDHRSRRVLLASVVMVLVIAIGWYLFSTSPITLSKAGYDLASALYAACNLEDPARLASVLDKLEQETLSPDERARVASIADLAQNGQWQDAAAKARYLLDSQDTP